MLFVRHFDESETSRPPSLAILDDVNRSYFSKLLECGSEIIVAGVERKVPYIDIRHKINPSNYHQLRRPRLGHSPSQQQENGPSCRQAANVVLEIQLASSHSCAGESIPLDRAVGSVEAPNGLESGG